MANYLLTHTGAQVDEAVSLALAGAQDESITSDKIADGAVTSIKIADSAVTGTQIADAAILPVKLSTGHPTWDSAGNLSATAFSGPLTGNVTGNVTGTAGKAVALTSASGAAPSFSARAFVSYDGVSMTVIGSGNISSVTRNGTGDYSVNFAVAMPSNAYAICVTAQRSASGGITDTGIIGGSSNNLTTATARIVTFNGAATTAENVPVVCAIVVV